MLHLVLKNGFLRVEGLLILSLLWIHQAILFVILEEVATFFFEEDKLAHLNCQQKETNMKL